MHASLTAKNVSLSEFYLRCPFHFVSSTLPLQLFLTLGEANAGSRLGSRNKVGHLPRRHKRLMHVSVFGARRIYINCKTCVFLQQAGLRN